MASDLYAAPRARVADVPVTSEDGDFVVEGQAVGAGNAWQWIVDAWGLFKQQPGMWLVNLAILFVLLFALNFVPFVGGLAAALLGPVFGGGIAIGSRALQQGDELKIEHLFAGFQHNLGKLVMIGVFNLVAWIGIGIVIAVIAGVGAVTGMMGSSNYGAGGNVSTILFAALVALALAVPVYMAMWFAPTLVALNDLDAMQAIKASFFGCARNIVPFLVYSLIMFVLAIIATLPLGLGWLMLGPVLVASIYTAYRDIFYVA